MSGIKMVPILNQVVNTVVEIKSVNKTMSVEINKLNTIIDHCGEIHLKAKANDYGIKFGKIEACESCDISKAKQKDTNKIWNGSSNTPRESLYVNISLRKDDSFGGAKF
jgi:hypothetical protein